MIRCSYERPTIWEVQQGSTPSWMRLVWFLGLALTLIVMARAEQGLLTYALGSEGRSRSSRSSRWRRAVSRSSVLITARATSRPRRCRSQHGHAFGPFSEKLSQAGSGQHLRGRCDRGFMSAGNPAPHWKQNRAPRAAPDLARRDPDFRRWFAKSERMYMGPKEGSRVLSSSGRLSCESAALGSGTHAVLHPEEFETIPPTMVGGRPSISPGRTWCRCRGTTRLSTPSPRSMLHALTSRSSLVGL